MQDAFSSYEVGLSGLLAKLNKDHPCYADALVYQQRLLENIAQARRYGDTEDRRAERAQIVDALNRLALEAVGVSFNELCGLPARDGVAQKRKPRFSWLWSLTAWRDNRWRLCSLLGFITTMAIILVLFRAFRCLLAYRLTDIIVGLLVVLIPFALGSFLPSIPRLLQSVLRSLEGGIAAALVLGIVTHVLLSPIPEALCDRVPTVTPRAIATNVPISTAPTPTFTSSPAPSLTSTLTPTPTLTIPPPTQTSTPTPTPTLTPTPTPDCKDVKVSYLELFPSTERAQREYPDRNDAIVITIEDIDELQNLLGEAVLTNTNLIDGCTCNWLRKVGDSWEPIDSQIGSCSFLIEVPDQVTVMHLWLTVGGQTKLIVKIQE